MEEPDLCSPAGANSIFAGEQRLPTPNPELEQAQALLDALGMRAMMPATTASDEVGSAETETPAAARA